MKSNHEVIVPNEELPFKMFLFEGNQGNYFRDRHWHHSIEIFAVFGGSLTFYLNDVKLFMQPGEFVLVNSNEIHAIDSPDLNHTVVLQIPLRAFSDYFIGEQYIHFTHNPRVQDEQVMHLIWEMYLTYNEKMIGYEMKVKSGYFMLLYLLVTKYREQDVDRELVKQYKKLNRLTIITDYMKENYQADLSLESLAETFGYAPAYLSRMFQKYAGINYKNFLENVRLEYAFRELKNESLTISEVALKHGFPNSKAFSRAFQRKYRMMPSEYRRMYKNESR